MPASLHYAAFSGDAQQLLVRTIREAILEAEPRISAARVELVASPTNPAAFEFVVTAQLATGRRQDNVAFRAQVGPGTQVRIRE
jgi:predicted component of type VI protein secretion system